MAHRLEHGGERRYLWEKRELCKMQPKLFGLIEVDGMDQRKTEVPRMEDEPKDLSSAMRVKNHVYGILINGEQFSIIHHMEHWACDPNMTVSILFQSLRRLPKPWPHCLLLQFDNCIKENKINKTVFLIASLLVLRGVFESVSSYYALHILFTVCNIVCNKL
jgi:hypothetical protein